MDWPRQGSSPDQHKYVWALRVMAGLAYLSLSSGDRVQTAALRHDKFQVWGPHRGRGYTMGMLQNLEKFYTRGETDLDVLLKQYMVRSGKRPGLCIVFSDMMSPNYRDGLTALQSRGFEIVLIQVLSPDEVNPPMNGDLRLIDIETGIPQDVTIDGAMLDLYQKRLLAWQEEIGEFCLRRAFTLSP
ncbi:MAG: hypothetical protein HC919_15815 [Oscillatoriales cyanobacterium SM2_2_1]|nr:hypothetical protein [Oscillatoriales cyanobacterium SM2_2_1]